MTCGAGTPDNSEKGLQSGENFIVHYRICYAYFFKCQESKQIATPFKAGILILSAVWTEFGSVGCGSQAFDK